MVLLKNSASQTEGIPVKHMENVDRIYVSKTEIWKKKSHAVHI
jgi:hypothetical protein